VIIIDWLYIYASNLRCSGTPGDQDSLEEGLLVLYKNLALFAASED
jgi:hypothetical protein